MREWRNTPSLNRIEMEQWYLLSEDCPNCGESVEVLTDANQQSEFETFAFDGDKVRCSNKCGFETIAIVHGDELGIMDGNIEKLTIDVNS